MTWRSFKAFFTQFLNNVHYLGLEWLEVTPSNLGEIIIFLLGPHYLSTILLKNSHRFKIVESKVSFLLIQQF